MPAASASEAGQDLRRSAATWIANEEAIFAIENDTLHLPLRNVVVDADRSIGTEDIQLLPLAQSIVDCLRHGVLGQQLLFPGKKPFA